MKDIVLSINNLTKYYGKVLAVDNLSLELHAGEIFGFIGPNGAGKSTTIRSIMGLINKTQGHIDYMGEPLNINSKYRHTIGYLPSEVNLYEDCSVKAMLDFHESYYSVEGIHDRRNELVSKLQLDESKKVNTLSFGNLKKLGIVLALMHAPKLVILDEPTSGLDPIIQQAFYDILREEKSKGTTIFYSTHILSEVSTLCDRVGIIKSGKLLSVETLVELKKKHMSIVSVESKDIESIEKDLKLEVVSKTDNSIVFKNTYKDDVLIKKLAKYSIDKIYIHEPSLEDIFLHYYK